MYTARIEQGFATGRRRLEVFLGGANFVTTAPHSFFGIVSSTGVIDFFIQDASPDPWWPFPSEADVVERLRDGTHLTVIGEISARRTGTTISGHGGVLTHSSGAQCAIESFEMVLSGDPGVGYWDY